MRRIFQCVLAHRRIMPVPQNYAASHVCGSCVHPPLRMRCRKCLKTFERQNSLLPMLQHLETDHRNFNSESVKITNITKSLPAFEKTSNIEKRRVSSVPRAFQPYLVLIDAEAILPYNIFCVMQQKEI